MPSAGHCEVTREVCEEGEVYVRKLNRFSDATCNRQVGDSFLFWSIVAIKDRWESANILGERFCILPDDSMGCAEVY
jgi:hypothetical protein